MPTPRAPSSPRLTVTVSKDIIDTAIRQDSGHCMIADAVRVAYPAAKSVSVDIQTIRFSDPAKGVRYTYLTPRLAQLALLHFDMGEEPEPFEIRLRRAHVTNMRSRMASRPISESGKKALRRNAENARSKWNQTVIADGGKGHHAGDDPLVAGGIPPPMGALPHGKTGRPRKGAEPPQGRRRTFGLRSMDRWSKSLSDGRPYQEG